MARGPFGKFVKPSAAPESAPESESAPEQSAQARLDALLEERDRITTELEQHRSEREAWLRDGGPIATAVELGAADELLRLRAEQLEAALPEAARVAEAERQAAHDQAWEQRRPVVESAEETLADAFAEVERAMRNLHAARRQAMHDGFSFEVARRPPPPQELLPYPISMFRMAIRKRAERRAQPPPEMLEIDVPAEPSWAQPAPPKFYPRPVPADWLERISLLLPPRRIRMLHTAVVDKVCNAYHRLEAGEELHLPAASAWALVWSGVAAYVDDQPPLVFEEETAA